MGGSESRLTQEAEHCPPTLPLLTRPKRPSFPSSVTSVHRLCPDQESSAPHGDSAGQGRTGPPECACRPPQARLGERLLRTLSRARRHSISRQAGTRAGTALPERLLLEESTHDTTAGETAGGGEPHCLMEDAVGPSDTHLPEDPAVLLPGKHSRARGQPIRDSPSHDNSRDAQSAQVSTAATCTEKTRSVFTVEHHLATERMKSWHVLPTDARSRSKPEIQMRTALCHTWKLNKPV